MIVKDKQVNDDQCNIDFDTLMNCVGLNNYYAREQQKYYSENNQPDEDYNKRHRDYQSCRCRMPSGGAGVC